MHYVIGDVHGCFKELNILVDKIERQDSNAIIYFVGDWVDRGPQVAEVMQWVVENITTTGKYRSVRGNHDQAAMDWYYAYFLPWTREEHDPYDSIPEADYDFASVVDNCFNRDPKAIEPFFDKVKSAMPYNRSIEITTKEGAKVKYRICHAWHRDDEKRQFVSNLYERNYWGNYVNDEIIVHGHTPTISEDYRDRGMWDVDRPGMIGYRHNAIDVDGGCCFQRLFPKYPCMLSGICLETLEEFYSHTIEERFLEVAEYLVKEHFESELEESAIEETVQSVRDGHVKRYLENKKPDENRLWLLKRLGIIQG